MKEWERAVTGRKPFVLNLANSMNCLTRSTVEYEKTFESKGTFLFSRWTRRGLHTILNFELPLIISYIHRCLLPLLYLPGGAEFVFIYILTINDGVSVSGLESLLSINILFVRLRHSFVQKVHVYLVFKYRCLVDSAVAYLSPAQSLTNLNLFLISHIIALCLSASDLFKPLNSVMNRNFMKNVTTTGKLLEL